VALEMAKKAKQKSATAAPPPSPPIGAVVINRFGPTQGRRIVKAKILESEIGLSDGTKLIVKPIVSDVRRALKQYNEHGQPLYFLALGYLITTIAPKHLLKRVPKKTKSKRK